MSSRKWAFLSIFRPGSPAVAGDDGQSDSYLYASGALPVTEQYPRHVTPQFWMEGEVLPETVQRRETAPWSQPSSPLHYWTQQPQRDIPAPHDHAYQPNQTLESLSVHMSRASSHKPEFDDSDKQAVTGREMWSAQTRSVECPIQRPPWYKRKKIWALATILIMGTVAVVLGIAFGLHLIAPPAPGRRIILPQIFSAAAFGDQDNEIYLFATAKDGTIWYLKAYSRGTTSWTNLGGQFLSQPTATIWKSPQRLDVFGVDSNHGVVYKTYEGDIWSDWRGLNAKAVSAVSSCRSRHEPDRVDIFALTGGVSNREIIHNYWDPANDDWLDNGTHPNGHVWDSASRPSLARGTDSTPAVVCRNDNLMHDMVIYDGETSAVLHRQWSSEASKWLDWSNRGGSFVGDPVVVSPSDDRVDFFGIGSDSAMYHFTWFNASGYTDLEKLNGSWASVPSVVPSANGRLDVFALDTERKLKHRALIGTAWQEGWEDMGITAQSAPLAVALNSSRSIGVFALNGTGNLLYGNYLVAGGASSVQETTKFYSIGGNLTDTWLAASNSSQIHRPRS